MAVILKILQPDLMLQYKIKLMMIMLILRNINIGMINHNQTIQKATLQQITKIREIQVSRISYRNNWMK